MLLRRQVLVDTLQAWLEHMPSDETWSPPVLKVISTTGQGVPELADACTRHREHLGVHEVLGAEDGAEEPVLGAGRVSRGPVDLGEVAAGSSAA